MNFYSGFPNDYYPFQYFYLQSCLPQPYNTNASGISNLDSPNRIEKENKENLSVVKLEFKEDQPLDSPENEAPIQKIKEKTKCKAQNKEKKISMIFDQTKNIPKNFGKAILAFARRHPDKVKSVANQLQIQSKEIVDYIRQKRKDLNTMEDLREMWGAGNPTDKLKKSLRIISMYFFRKCCLNYIFNSRIKNIPAHIKYRHRVIAGLKNPSKFLYLKMIKIKFRQN